MTNGPMCRAEVLFYWVLIVVAALASLVVTRDGVGIDADSAAYLGTAHNIVEGRGVTVPFSLFTDEDAPRDAARLVGEAPLTHFPPLYPLALGAIAAVGPSVELAARLLGAVLLAINLGLIALLARSLVPSVTARVAVVVLAAIGPVSPDLLRTIPRTWLMQHSQAMSEGLFTTFALLTLLAIDAHMRAPSRRTLLLIAGAAALALATRYSGLAVVGTAALAVAVVSTGPAVQRAVRGLLVAALAIAPTLAWQVWLSLTARAHAARAFHWPNRGPQDLPSVFEGWLGVSGASPAVRHLVLLAVVATVACVRTRSADRRMHGALSTYLILYVLVVVITRAALDASTPIDARMLLPLQGPFYVLVAGAIVSVLAPAAGRHSWAAATMRVVAVGVPLVLVAVAVPTTGRLVMDGLPERPDATFTALATADLPRGALIATNIPAQVWQATGRESIRVPRRIRVATDAVNTSFDDELRELVRVVCEEHGYIVLLGGAIGGFGTMHQANEVDFAPFPTLRIDRNLDDGLILSTTTACA